MFLTPPLPFSLCKNQLKKKPSPGILWQKAVTESDTSVALTKPNYKSELEQIAFICDSLIKSFGMNINFLVKSEMKIISPHFLILTQPVLLNEDKNSRREGEEKERERSIVFCKGSQYFIPYESLQWTLALFIVRVGHRLVLLQIYVDSQLLVF